MSDVVPPPFGAPQEHWTCAGVPLKAQRHTTEGPGKKNDLCLKRERAKEGEIHIYVYNVRIYIYVCIKGQKKNEVRYLKKKMVCLKLYWFHHGNWLHLPTDPSPSHPSTTWRDTSEALLPAKLGDVQTLKNVFTMFKVPCQWWKCWENWVKSSQGESRCCV